MRVAIVIPGFSDGENDWCIPVYLNLVRRLAAEIDVYVFAMRYPARRDTYQVYTAQVRAIGGRYDTAGIGRLGLWQRTLAAIRREHRRAPFDVIHAIWADESGLVANLAGRLLNVPTLVSVAGGELVGLPDIGYGLQRGRLSRQIVRWALRGADRVIAPSHYAAALAHDWVVPEKLIVSALGVDTELFSPGIQTQTAGGVRLLAVGSLTAIKDHASLLRIFAALRTPGISLEIAGEGPLEAALRTQAESLGIADRVHISGGVTYDALPEVYRAADVHVLTSRHEAFGMVMIEAAACGLPTVGYAHGILPELAFAQAGIAVPSGDELALAGALDALLADRVRLADMRQAARRIALERFTLAAMTEGVRDAYRTVCKG